MSTGAIGAAQPQQTILVGGKSMPLEQAQNAARNAASWFWWIAGLSLVNSVAAILQLDYAMILGLGVTQIADAILAGILKETSGGIAVMAKLIHLVEVLVAAGFFYLMGVKARAMRVWAYTLGMLVYSADAAIFLLVQDWVGVGFHVFVLFMLFGGYSLTKAIRAAQAAPGLPAHALAGG
jgi:hypothetical protein